MKDWNMCAEIVESITTKERHMLSIFVSIKKLLDQKEYDGVKEIVDECIKVQKLNLQDWIK